MVGWEIAGRKHSEIFYSKLITIEALQSNSDADNVGIAIALY
jgi:hypothetical protein